MLRIAVSTSLKRLTVVLGSGGIVYLTKPTSTSVTHNSSSSVVNKNAECISSKNLSPSLPLVGFPTIFGDMDALLGSAKSLLEASTRAIRLIDTVVMIVYEYKKDQYKRCIYTSLVSLGTEPNLPSSDRAILVEEVRRCTRELEDAQERHTSIDGEEKGYKKRREDVLVAAERLGMAERALVELDNDDRGWEDDVHARAAKRLLLLCRTNGGCYIKVGQHLANLDHLLPPAYIKILHSLFGDAPVTPYDDVREVIKEELGTYPEQLFESFDADPIASASLAQVHVAKERGGDGKKLAIKVQHRGLRETSKGDLIALETVVRLLDSLFDEFKWGWIVDEIAPNLPKELDFCYEGKNADLAASHMKKAGLNCIVPEVHWDQTTSRVLVMDFLGGYSVTDHEAIEKAGIRKHDLASIVSSVFQSQIFQTGFVHCDPHPANVHWRLHRGKPQVILFDHGLYKQLDEEFRMTYAKLWKSLLIADVKGIKESCSSLGVEEMVSISCFTSTTVGYYDREKLNSCFLVIVKYPLLSAMLTSRPFDEIVERTKTKSFACRHSIDSASDTAMIRGYAQRYLKEIIQMLDRVPRQMLLLFKMNDCLRHIDHSIGSPSNTLIIAGKYASTAVYNNQIKQLTIFGRIREWIFYVKVMSRIKVYEFVAARSWSLLKNG